MFCPEPAGLLLCAVLLPHALPGDGEACCRPSLELPCPGRRQLQCMSAVFLPSSLKCIPVLARAAHDRSSEDRWGEAGVDAVVDINDEGSSLTALHVGPN